ncbi:endospore germination permease [Brevibacillus sp. HD1.4A]|uniref:GerAB/ArcD/ProY family transporter n=1 Tax=Brevibacillus sp. HD1.4A TaxID=2738978 RepID=UPI00156B57B4|nr:endospore germination permease [Brevibacillus sp. HD1.4A]NRQ53443.1 endospore germination permease [Brevibacillus sp. HD1.4A]
MLEKGKISAFQMAVLMYPTIVATALLTVPSITAAYADNDLWLSPIWASLIGFVTVLVVDALHRRYPQKTIIQYSEHILGKLLGKAFGAFLMLLYVLLTALVVRIYAEFLVGSFLTQTPIVVVISTMLLLCAFAVRGGVEVIARAATAFSPFFVLPLLLLIVLLFTDFQLDRIFPIMVDGVGPSLKGALIPQGWFTEYMLLAFLLPFLTDREKGRKWGVLSVFAVMLTLLISNLIVLFLFGTDVATMLYPLMAAARYVSFADFFENLESLVMAIWIMGAFIKISVFYYATALGSAQLLNLSDYRPIVLPLGFLITLFSFWSIPSLMETSKFDVAVFPFLGPLVLTLLPLLLLLLSFVRPARQEGKSS